MGMIDRFIGMGVDDLQFSMQGLTPEQYEFNRRRSSHDRLLANMEMASARRGADRRPFLSVLTSVLADEARAAEFVADLERAKIADPGSPGRQTGQRKKNPGFGGKRERIRPFSGGDDEYRQYGDDDECPDQGGQIDVHAL